MRATRTGFTVVEMLVALTLLGIGVSAWLHTTTVALQVAGAARRSSEAHLAARARVERLAGGPCAAMTSGSAAGERWTVTALANGVHLVRAEVDFIAESGMRTAQHEAMVVCG